MSVAHPSTETQAVPRAASASWRTWLLTGIRQDPIARRRVRGAHKGLKRMLVEGMTGQAEGPRTWNSFSGSMVRQAVEEAVSSLPPREKQLIKLAYFSDLSNREIARGLGITLSSVERGLRQAVARVSDHVERGRAAGRRVIYALTAFLGGRWLTEAHQSIRPSVQEWVSAGALVIAGATAATVLASQTASPARLAPVEPGSLPAIVSSQPYAAVVRHRAVDIRQSTNELARRVASAGGDVRVSPLASAALPATSVPALPLPISVKLPPIPPVPILHGLLGA